ncbi:MAG: clan AA aspartic protease [Chloroflexota bacterium]|nr:clan AA aspartic protease [Chloroflexota bacterium]
MGTFSVDVEIGDPDGREFIVVNALVDTGAPYTALPESLLQRLRVRPRADRRFRLADGRVVRLPLGVTVMRFMDEEWPVYVIFAPDDSQPLLGATALEAFSLVVDLNEGRLVPADALLL